MSARRRPVRHRRPSARTFPNASGQRGANLVGYGLEAAGIGARHIGENLAVDIDPRQLKAVHKSRIGHAFDPRRGVDALDPQRPERALAHLAVAVGVLPGLVDRRLGRADGVLAPATETLGLLQNLFVLGMGRYAPFDTRHFRSPLSVVQA